MEELNPPSEAPPRPEPTLATHDGAAKYINVRIENPRKMIEKQDGLELLLRWVDTEDSWKHYEVVETNGQVQFFRIDRDSTTHCEIASPLAAQLIRAMAKVLDQRAPTSFPR